VRQKKWTWKSQGTAIFVLIRTQKLNVKLDSAMVEDAVHAGVTEGDRIQGKRFARRHADWIEFTATMT